jgi:exopolysaccharide biosynthesis operon protein EpsL
MFKHMNNVFRECFRVHACEGRIRPVVRARLPAILSALFCIAVMQETMAATDHRDTLERALAPDDEDIDLDKSFDISVGDRETYDSNLFRLPSSVTDLTDLIGPDASRGDHVNSSTAGFDGKWSRGRQLFSVNLTVADNRFARNDDLNNVSANGGLLWRWQFGPQLSGEVGADYSRFLTSFINTFYYHRDIYTKKEYFGTGRYQLGPHWAVFGGVLTTDSSLSADVTRANDLHSNSVDLGVEYAEDSKKSIGATYRYTDTRFPVDSTLGGVLFNPDYREDTEQGFLKYAPSDKVLVNANGGYSRREYSTSAIGSFSGDIWRVSLQWQPTQKTTLGAEAWRQLQAYLTSQSNYYVSKGVSISPTWAATEKVTLSIDGSWDKQSYIGSISGGDSLMARRDSVASQSAKVLYKPMETITVDISFTREKRSSNEALFTYNDRLVSAGFTVKFQL